MRQSTGLVEDFRHRRSGIVYALKQSWYLTSHEIFCPKRNSRLCGATKNRASITARGKPVC